MSSLGMPSAKTMLSTAASLAASAMVVRTLVNDFLPHRIQDQIFSSLYTFINSFSSELTIIVEEYNGFSVNELYSAAEIYLGSKISPTTRRLKVFKQEKEKSFATSMVKNEEIVESYQGMKLEWKFVCRESERNSIHSYDGRNSITRSEIRFYHLSFHKKHKHGVLQSYLPHVLRQSKAILEEKKTLKLHTVNCDRMYGHMQGAWTSVNLDHPATFSTVAMESEQKQTLMEDLERFVKRKEFYKRVGKAWKRGYLLYGPPGTGKSSLIAAIANFLNFDVYDLELTDIKRNSDLRRLLVATANRSILVIEDIDCTVEFKDRAPAPPAEESRKQNQKQENPPMTLSGLLNFIDGLWSSCGDERIIIFTTNHKDKLDAALLRPGRMDMHIHMSYCGFCGFKTLAKNYLMVDDHPLFEEIQRLIAEVEVTPADVAEVLMKSDNPNVAFRGLVQFLQKKKIEAEEAKNKGEKDDQRQGATDQEIKNEGQDGIIVEKKESNDLRLNGE